MNANYKSLLGTTAVLALTAISAQAQITYVDADTSNQAGTTNTTLADGSPFTPPIATGTVPPDNQWHERTGFANDGDILAVSGGSDAPVIKTTISGLTPGTDYDVFAYYWWADNFGNGEWDLGAGFTQAGITHLLYTDGDPITAAFANGPILVVEGNRDMYQYYIGIATATGAGTIEVFIDDNPGNDDRTWYDGVGTALSVDADGDGYSSGFDCDDADAAINPGAAEICGDGIDQDCDGADMICPPANNDCAGATPVALGPNAVGNLAASASGVSPAGLPPFVDADTPDTECDFNQTMNNDTWHTFTATGNGVFLFSTCNQASYDTKLAVYSGPCGAEVPVACNDDGTGCAGFSTTLRATLSSGSDYLVQVGGFDAGAIGTATMDISQEGVVGVGVNYCPLTVNSAGAGTVMSGSGSASVAANDLVIEASNGPASQPGVFFYGPAQIQVPFGDGNRCVGGAVIRLWPPSAADVSGFNSRAVDNTAPAIAGGAAPILAGVTLNFQYWHRDPAGGPSGFNLSDALEILFGA
jgi:hypothetical protein